MKNYESEATIENRLFPRKSLKILINYHCIDEQEQHQSPSKSVSQDFSLGGISFTSEDSLEAGQLIMVTLFLPPKHRIHAIHEAAISNVKECIPANALCRVAWCRAHYPDKYILGVQFLHLISEDRKKIELFSQNFREQGKF